VTRSLAAACGLLLAACGGSEIRVSGSVVDDGRGPVAGAAVSIPGHAAAITDAAGRFAVDGVTRPYDLTLVSAADRIGVVYLGLTRPDPALRLFRVRSVKQGSVSGAVSGGAGYPQPVGRSTLLAFLSSVGRGQGTTAADGSFSLPDVRWFDGSPTVAGRLHALQVDMGPSGPVGYPGYGDTGFVSVGEGAPLAGQAIALESPVVTSTIDGSMSLPAGYSPLSREIDIQLVEGPWRMVLLTEASPGPAFSYLTPLITGAHYDLVVSAQTAAGEFIRGGRYYLPGTATGLSLALPPAPALVLPGDGAAGIGAGSPFSWGAYATSGSVYRVAFEPQRAGDPELHVVTTATRATLPDLRAQGLGLPSLAPYRWSVRAEGPWQTLEDSLGFDLPAAYAYALTAPRSFATAP
jgi:hypothetical protein